MCGSFTPKSRPFGDRAAAQGGSVTGSPVCPETGAPLCRGVRPMTLTYRGNSATFDMPGWYCDRSEESIHGAEDLEVSDRVLYRLKESC